MTSASTKVIGWLFQQSIFNFTQIWLLLLFTTLHFLFFLSCNNSNSFPFFFLNDQVIEVIVQNTSLWFPDACDHAHNRVGKGWGDVAWRRFFFFFFNVRDFISQIAPRPMIFPTADRRWKPLPELSGEESSLSSLAHTDWKYKSRTTGLWTASPPGLPSSILFWQICFCFASSLFSR